MASPVNGLDLNVHSAAESIRHCTPKSKAPDPRAGGRPRGAVILAIGQADATRAVRVHCHTAGSSGRRRRTSNDISMACRSARLRVPRSTECSGTGQGVSVPVPDGQDEACRCAPGPGVVDRRGSTRGARTDPAR